MTTPAFPRPVALVGMPGAGKSTLGRLLARELGWPFVDVDAAVAEAAGRAIPEIFAAEGEAGFRARERAAIAGALALGPVVLATGGGAFADPATRGLIRRAARTLWLRAGVNVLARRIGSGAGRPMLAGDPRARLAELAARRSDAYAEADLVIDAVRSPRRTLAAALEALGAGPARERVPVTTSRHDYEVVIGSGLLGEAGARARALSSGRRAAVVADRTTARLFGPAVGAALAAEGFTVTEVVLPPGEAAKSWEGLAEVTGAFARAGLTRHDLAVALGGGVIGDLTGFAAAVYMRGIDWVGVPTTLLAQVDSSVGGKTAIDTPAGKNLVGAFWPPRLVLADLDTLGSLPPREVRAGYAEVLKYGLLGDARLFGWLEANGAEVLSGDPSAMRDAVSACVAMKARIVTADEHEAGERALLNLGHTFGHALEAEAGYSGALLHGEAVAVGMAQAFRFAERIGLCREAGAAARVERVLRAAGLPASIAETGLEFEPQALMARMAGDKKAGTGGIVLVLPTAVGATERWPLADAGGLGAFLAEEAAICTLA